MMKFSLHVYCTLDKYICQRFYENIFRIFYIFPFGLFSILFHSLL